MSRVEYHDPDGLYPLVAPQLQAHLPLKNLYWNSANRPLRSISTLEVDFVARPKTDVLVSNPGALEDGSRKHQLAGLRATPLLKIFLLRCDDKESYSALKFALLRDWLDNNVRAAQKATTSKKHDACEWLILHIVLPNTVAATQPRWSKSSGSDDEATREKSASKRWPGKGSRGIFEKLRSDFGSDKKSDTDHVAQIRLLAGDIPSQALPPKLPGAQADYAETVKERENAWSDLLAKLKAGILASFDLRVGQYEDDIHVRDMQRTLPGWNFCTFFVLKEGLALAFESVGLLEDALAIYDELSVDFETIVSDQLSGENPNAGGAFAPHTAEAANLIWPSDKANPTQPASSLFVEPFNPSRKNYRELIASSLASIFDLRLYLCARRNALLLKLAKPLLGPANRDFNGQDTPLPSVKRDSWEGPEKLDDMSALAKICRTAPETITMLARTLRRDLHDASADQISKDEACRVDAVVSAWTYAACSQLFAETASFRLPETVSNAGSATGLSSPMAQSMVDQRTPKTSHKTRLKINPSTTPEHFPTDVPTLKHEGLANSAAHRADVLLLQRRIVERVATWCNRPLDSKGVSDESVEEDERPDSAHSRSEGRASNSEETLQAKQLSLMSDSLLSQVAATTQSLQRTYHELSDVAAVLYMSAGRTKSAERLMADVGTMKFAQKNYATAAGYLGRVAAKFAEGRWSIVEGRVLQMHMECLKMLNRRDDCLRVGLGLLAKSADARKTPAGHTPAGDWRGQMQELQAAKSWLKDSKLDSEALLKDMAEYSHQLTYDMVTPLNRYFADFEGDRRIEQLQDQDGFQIGITIRQLVADEKITVDFMEARLISAEDGQSREITLRSTEPVQVNFSKTRVCLKGNVSTSGSYLFDKLTLRSGRLLFVWEAMGKTNAATPIGLLTSTAAAAVSSAKRAAIYCYPRPRSLRASLSASSTLRLGKTRAVDLLLFSGDNEITGAQIVLRSGSAGLRLRTADASVSQGDLVVDNVSDPGVIETGSIGRDSQHLLTIPYDLEGNLPALYVRLEVHYFTEKGNFSYFANTDIDIELPLDVTVQDCFKAHALVSKFFIRATHKGPVRVHSTDFQESDAFQVQPLPTSLSPAIAFQQEPLCLTYRIIQRGDTKAAGQQKALPLTIRYQTIRNEVIVAASLSLKQSIAESDFADFQWLLVHRLEGTLVRNIQAAELEAACLVQCFRLPSLHDLGLIGAMEAVEPKKRAALTAWLESWYQANLTISIDKQDRELSIHTIGIEFEVPSLQYLHTTAFVMPVNTAAQTGRPLHCQVKTRYTRCWDNTESSSGTPEEFTYDIEADSNVWIVSGAKRGNFRAAPDEELCFGVVVIAMRPGRAALPKVMIRPLGSETQPEASLDDISTLYYTSPTSTSSTQGPMTSVAASSWSSSPGGNGTEQSLEQSGERGYCETDCISAFDEVDVIDGWTSVAVGLFDADVGNEVDDEETMSHDSMRGFDGEARLLESRGLLL